MQAHHSNSVNSPYLPTTPGYKEPSGQGQVQATVPAQTHLQSLQPPQQQLQHSYGSSSSFLQANNGVPGVPQHSTSSVSSSPGAENHNGSSTISQTGDRNSALNDPFYYYYSSSSVAHQRPTTTTDNNAYNSVLQQYPSSLGAGVRIGIGVGSNANAGIYHDPESTTTSYLASSSVDDMSQHGTRMVPDIYGGEHTYSGSNSTSTIAYPFDGALSHQLINQHAVGSSSSTHDLTRSWTQQLQQPIHDLHLDAHTDSESTSHSGSRHNSHSGFMHSGSIGSTSAVVPGPRSSSFSSPTATESSYGLISKVVSSSSSIGGGIDGYDEHGHPAELLNAQPQGTQPQSAPPAKAKFSSALWTDEGTMCLEVETQGIIVARRQDNDMVNGTKLLNVSRMTRGRRDGILKLEKVRTVVKSGPMNYKGVWIPLDRAIAISKKEGIFDIVQPLFTDDMSSYLTNPTNIRRSSNSQKDKQAPSSSSSSSNRYAAYTNDSAQEPPNAIFPPGQQQQNHNHNHNQIPSSSSSTSDLHYKDPETDEQISNMVHGRTSFSSSSTSSQNPYGYGGNGNNLSTPVHSQTSTIYSRPSSAQNHGKQAFQGSVHSPEFSQQAQQQAPQQHHQNTQTSFNTPYYSADFHRKSTVPTYMSPMSQSELESPTSAGPSMGHNSNAVGAASSSSYFNTNASSNANNYYPALPSPPIYSQVHSSYYPQTTSLPQHYSSVPSQLQFQYGAANSDVYVPGSGSNYDMPYDLTDPSSNAATAVDQHHASNGNSNQD